MDLNINGNKYSINVEPNMPLLWAVREVVGLTGTKYGCGIAQCGACSVLMNGELLRSCSVSVSSAVGQKIVTIEGLSKDSSTALQKAWIALDVPQCGYCQSGQLMAATALLKRKPKPTDADIDSAMANICRCGTYQRVRDGIYVASGQKKLTDVLKDYANPGSQQKA
jgi:isoquinoline 1-oxidoreductase alpha subunit